MPPSTPQDVAARLDVLRSPRGRALIESLMPYEPATALAHVDALRRDARWVGRPDVVAAAATQARLRTRAAARFPGPARWWTAEGLEQATRPAVAGLHAARFADAGLPAVLDLGCGVGSDALALAAAGLRVTAVDRDAEALWALAATAEDLGLPVTTVWGDVRTMPGPWQEPARRGAGPGGPGGLGCFVDPARRTSAGRVRDPGHWSPPWPWVLDLARRLPATGAKVAPGIDHAQLPVDAQAEWVSLGGDLVETGVWWGPLRRGPAARQATVLRPGHPPAVLDDTDGIPAPTTGTIGAWLVEPDPAVIRAGLVSTLAQRISGRLVDPRIAYITTDDTPDTAGLGTLFAVREQVPFARKAMRAWLRTRGYGDVVVKKRGVAVVPEQLRAALRLPGGAPTATLVLTRTDAGPLALLVDRVDPGSAGARGPPGQQ